MYKMYNTVLTPGVLQFPRLLHFFGICFILPDCYAFSINNFGISFFSRLFDIKNKTLVKKQNKFVFCFTTVHRLHCFKDAYFIIQIIKCFFQMFFVAENCKSGCESIVAVN